MTHTWALFDRLADRYDEVVPFFATFAQELLDVLPPVPGTALLDVGAGRGAIAIAAAARGCRVTAIDGAPRMVQLMRAAHPSVDAHVMDAVRLEFPDDAFDLATAGFMIHLVGDPARALTELRRVVRPGGQVALTVPGACAQDNGRWDSYHQLVREFEPRATRTRSPGRPLNVAQALRDAGFTEVWQASIEVHLPIADPRTCWDFSMSHGFAGFVEALSQADADELQQRAMAEFAAMHADGGIMLDRGAQVHLARVPI